MKSIFFLIPLLFIVSTIPPAFAEIEYTAFTEKEVNSDGTIRLKNLSYERILDGNGYKDYIFTDTGSTLTVETMEASLVLDKNICTFNFYNKGYLLDNPTPLFSDMITPFNSVAGSNVWNEVSQISNTTCETYWTGTELVAKKYVNGVGIMEYKYILNNGTWKTQLEATNLTSLTDRIFGFDQTIQLNRDTIMINNVTRNLDNFDGTTFDRTWLENNQGKVIDFLNGYNFDFDLGFDNLDGISIVDNGANSTLLTFHYMRNDVILLPNQTLIIDPTITQGSYNDGSGTGGGGDDNVGEQVKSTGELNGMYITSLEFYMYKVGSPVNNYQLAIVDSSNVLQLSFCSKDASLLGTTGSPSTITCAGGGSYQMADDDRFGIIYSDASGIVAIKGQNTDVYDGTNSYLVEGTNELTTRDLAFEVIYSLTPVSSIPTPDAVDDLSGGGITKDSVDLSWTEPNLNTGNLTGYQFNYTTPEGSPMTIIENNTGGGDITKTISSLAENTDYSMRLGIFTEGRNMTGNIYNFTTLEDFVSGNYTPGFFDLNVTSSDIIQIFFERQDINSTALFLNVTYPGAYSLACDFDYQFANINQTYKGLATVVVSHPSISSAVESSFHFIDIDNEIVDVYCWDENNGDNDGTYIITQTTFELLNQINNFRNGTYGTQGDFGTMDIITLAVIIISMIGFNRVNDAVGAIFNFILIGSLAYFGIIELPTIIFGAVAVFVMLGIAITRKT